MAEMGLGYGSEYQLLRFLGHHRGELETIILRSLEPYPDYMGLQWLDFPRDNSRLSLDGEYKGINFLPSGLQNKLAENWKKYWPQTGKPPNWDAILHCTPVFDDTEFIEEEWMIIEAKAHLGEMESSCGAAGTSREIISKAFDETKKRFDIQTSNDWFEKYYQLANRLAFVNFMLDNGLKVSILNIFFVNGWPNDPEKNVKNQDAWKEKIKEEHAYLGLNEEARKYITDIFIEC